jgi:hypothetical protein
MSFRVTEIWAWLAVGDDNEEGIVAFQGPDGWLPLVMADRTRLDSLRSLAEEIARQGDKTLHLVRLSAREEIDSLPPGKKDGLHSAAEASGKCKVCGHAIGAGFTNYCGEDCLTRAEHDHATGRRPS